jgi:hypothetical protein
MTENDSIRDMVMWNSILVLANLTRCLGCRIAAIELSEKSSIPKVLNSWKVERTAYKDEIREMQIRNPEFAAITLI